MTKAIEHMTRLLQLLQLRQLVALLAHFLHVFLLKVREQLQDLCLAANFRKFNDLQELRGGLQLLRAILHIVAVLLQ